MNLKAKMNNGEFFVFGGVRVDSCLYENNLLTFETETDEIFYVPSVAYWYTWEPAFPPAR